MVNKLLEYQIRNKCIYEHEKDLYVYAYTILFEECINIVIAFLFGIFFRNVSLIFFFLCSYISLRRYAGGYHADSSLRCGSVSSLLILGLCFIEKTGILKFIQNTSVILLVAHIFILTLTPVDSYNKRLNDFERKKYHKTTVIILLIQVIILHFGIYLNKDFLIGGITYSHIVLMFMLLIGICKNMKSFKLE